MSPIVKVPPLILSALRFPVDMLPAFKLDTAIPLQSRVPVVILLASNTPLAVILLNSALPLDLCICQPALPVEKLSDCKLAPIGTNPVGVPNVITCTGIIVVTTALSR